MPNLTKTTRTAHRRRFVELLSGSEDPLAAYDGATEALAAENRDAQARQRAAWVAEGRCRECGNAVEEEERAAQEEQAARAGPGRPRTGYRCGRCRRKRRPGKAAARTRQGAARAKTAAPPASSTPAP